MKITINGEAFENFEGGIPESPDHTSYERVVTLAGLNPAHNPSVTYDTTRKGDEQRDGILSPGRVVRVEDGMHFTAVYTGNA